jgi:hypothetical protein
VEITQIWPGSWVKDGGMLQFNGDWRELADAKRVSLFKFINNEWRLFDFGVEPLTDKYIEKGHMVRKFEKGDKLGDIAI